MRLLIPLFSPATGTWGGLTRVIALADAALAAGHTVAFCAAGALAMNLQRRKYLVYPIPATTMLGLPAPLAHILERRSQQTTLPVKSGRSIGNIWLVLTISGQARHRYLRHVVAAELHAVHAFQPDAIFTDLDPAAFLTARIARLPMAAAYADVMRTGIGSWPYRLMQRAVSATLRFYHQPVLSASDLMFGPDVLKIIPSIPALDGTDPDRPDVCYVGHLLGTIEPGQTAAFQPETEKRYVFGYVGTGSIGVKRLREVLPPCFPPDGSRICLIGAQSITQPEQIANVEFRPYVPAEAVLPVCDWTLCHGGQNTIIQSLLHGVPLLVIPGPIFERRFNAQKVVEAGAGLMAELDQVTVPWLQDVLDHTEPYASRAAALGRQLRSYGGAPAAIAAIAAHAGQPIPIER